MKYGARIKDLLSDKDLKQKTLAKELNLTESTLSNYITQRTDMPPEILAGIAERLSVTTDYILGLSDDPSPPFPVSGSERVMLEQFRQLTREQRELILQNIKLMGEQNRRK